MPGNFDEQEHPRGGKGTSEGGRFVKKGSSGSPVSAKMSFAAAKKKQAAAAAAKNNAATVAKNAVEKKKKRQGIAGQEPDWSRLPGGLRGRAQWAVASWVGGQYDDINSSLREGWSQEAQERLIRGLDYAFDATPGLPEDTTVFRGVTSDFSDQLEVGSTWTDKGFAATTTDQKTAEEIAAGGAVMVMVLPKGTKALTPIVTDLDPQAAQLIKQDDLNPDKLDVTTEGVEPELLLNRGTSFTVIEKKGQFIRVRVNADGAAVQQTKEDKPEPPSSSEMAEQEPQWQKIHDSKLRATAQWAIAAWVGGQYDDINDALREGEETDWTTSKSQKLIRGLDRAFEVAPGLSRDVIMHRGLSEDFAHSLDVGSTWIDRGFSAWTPHDDTTAKGFAGEGGIVMRAVLPKGTKAIKPIVTGKLEKAAVDLIARDGVARSDIPELLAGGSESELLLNRGTGYKIVGKDGDVFLAEVIARK